MVALTGPACSAGCRCVFSGQGSCQANARACLLPLLHSVCCCPRRLAPSRPVQTRACLSDSDRASARAWAQNDPALVGLDSSACWAAGACKQDAYQQDIVKDTGHVGRRRIAAAGSRIPCSAHGRWRRLRLRLLRQGIGAPLQGSPGVLHHAGVVVRLDVVCIAMPAALHSGVLQRPCLL